MLFFCYSFEKSGAFFMPVKCWYDCLLTENQHAPTRWCCVNYRLCVCCHAVANCCILCEPTQHGRHGEKRSRKSHRAAQKLNKTEIAMQDDGLMSWNFGKAKESKREKNVWLRVKVVYDWGGKRLISAAVLTGVAGLWREREWMEQTWSFSQNTCTHKLLSVYNSAVLPEPSTRRQAAFTS